MNEIRNTLLIYATKNSSSTDVLVMISTDVL